MLSEIARAELTSLEIYCAPEHFNYRSPEAVREIAGLLGEHRLSLHALHSPTERDTAPGRDSGVPISISDTERIRRIDAVDEVKRALEVAERIPFRYLVQQLGNGRQMADPRKTDAAFSSLEHLTVFAKARGVTIALENTPDELGAPGALRHFVQETHLHDLKLCFDAGHAHLEGGVEASFEVMGDLVATTHIHDNRGEKDEHLLPWEGTIDWDAALRLLSSVKEPLPIVLEIKAQAGGAPPLDHIRRTFDKLENAIEARH